MLSKAPIKFTIKLHKDLWDTYNVFSPTAVGVHFSSKTNSSKIRLEIVSENYWLVGKNHWHRRTYWNQYPLCCISAVRQHRRGRLCQEKAGLGSWYWPRGEESAFLQRKEYGARSKTGSHSTVGWSTPALKLLGYSANRNQSVQTDPEDLFLSSTYASLYDWDKIRCLIRIQ